MNEVIGNIFCYIYAGLPAVSIEPCSSHGNTICNKKPKCYFRLFHIKPYRTKIHKSTGFFFIIIDYRHITRIEIHSEVFFNI